MEEKKRLKVFHVQGWTGYSSWIGNVEPVKTIEEADLVLFPGGSDISPELYGHKKHPKTHPFKSRDQEEVHAYRKAEALGKKIFGTCRGAQLICALQPGGMLIQDQPNPGYHSIKTIDGRELQVNSLHHQAQYPFKMNEGDYKILAWSDNILSFHQGGLEEELHPKKECEIVYYPKAKALGVQHHPEMMRFDSEANIWLRELLDKFMKDEL